MLYRIFSKFGMIFVRIILDIRVYIVFHGSSILYFSLNVLYVYFVVFA